jgi:hypothetical protein
VIQVQSARLCFLIANIRWCARAKGARSCQFYKFPGVISQGVLDKIRITAMNIEHGITIGTKMFNPSHILYTPLVNTRKKIAGSFIGCVSVNILPVFVWRYSPSCYPRTMTTEVVFISLLYIRIMLGLMAWLLKCGDSSGD